MEDIYVMTSADYQAPDADIKNFHYAPVGISAYLVTAFSEKPEELGKDSLVFDLEAYHPDVAVQEGQVVKGTTVNTSFTLKRAGHHLKAGSEYHLAPIDSIGCDYGTGVPEAE